METVYVVCAALGGTLLLCQFVMSALGFAGDHDADGHGDAHDTHDDAHHDDDGARFVGVLTFRTIVAGLALFGLGGMTGHSQDWEPPAPLLFALGCGAGGFFLVSFLMRSMHQLKDDGTVRIDRAVGKSGTVYLTVPGQKAGPGKVTLKLQNRLVEYQAVTAKETLPTGAEVVVVAVVAADTVEVELAPPTERTSHA